MKIYKISIALITVASVIMAGCAPTNTPTDKPTPKPSLPSQNTGTSLPASTVSNTPAPINTLLLNEPGWLLESLDGQAVIPGSQVTIRFEEDRFYGTDGCNQYNGSLKLEAEKINIDENIATTRKACEESIMQQASAYLAMLVKAATYKVSDQQMVLLDDGGKTLATFTPILILTGKDPQNATYLIDDKPITLVNGVFEQEAAPGSATKQVTRYFGNAVEIDLNGDGRMDSAFLLEQNLGGSGIFYYVVAALNTPDGIIGTNAIFIGDRIAPQNLNADFDNPDQFIVNYLERKPDEPMTTQPSVGVSRWFKVQDDRLVEITLPTPTPTP
jgi:heat shock protein HslJ